jgi:hypothetical protein
MSLANVISLMLLIVPKYSLGMDKQMIFFVLGNVMREHTVLQI